MASVTGTWPGSFSATSEQPISTQPNPPNPPPPPPASSCLVECGNSGDEGNWLFVLLAWRNPEGDVTLTPGDQVGGYWEPLGAPVGTTPYAGQLRQSVWFCRAPAAGVTVYVSPDGYCPAICALACEVSGLSPWSQAALLVPGYVNAATSLSVTAPAPAGTALMFGLAAYDDQGAAPTVLPTGWSTPLPVVSVSNGGGDYTNDLYLHPYWQSGTGATSLYVSDSIVTQDFVALICGVLVTGAPPVPESQSWPYTLAQVAFGAGATTPWDMLTWTDITTRYRGLSVGRGKQYELDTIQSGQGNWALSNNDGALTGDNTSGEYYQGVTGWAGAGGTLDPAGDLDPSWHGLSGAVLTPDGVTANPAAENTGAPVTARLTYYCIGSAYCAAGWDAVNLSVAWSDVSGAYLSASLAATGTIPAGGWLPLAGPVTAPAGAVTGRIILSPQGTPLPSNRFWITAGYLISPYGQVLNTNPVFAQGPKVFAPVRLLEAWPPPPSTNSRTYVTHRGYMQRWPQSLTSARYQVANAVSVDVWALTTALLKTLPRAEMAEDNPVAMWPCDDPAGSMSAAQKAPTSAGALRIVQSKYGAGGAVQQFGVSASELAGDPGTTAWQVSGVTTATQGYALYYQDDALPGLAGGAAVETWTTPAVSQPAGNPAVITVSSGSGIAAQVYLDSSTGKPYLSIGAGAGGGTPDTEGPWWPVSLLDGKWHQFCLVFGIPDDAYNTNLGQYALFIDGQLAGTVGPFPGEQINVPWALSVAGVATPFLTGQFGNFQVAHTAVYPVPPSPARVATRYLAMLTAMHGTDLAGQRVERLLSAGNAAFPRCIPPGANAVVGAVDIAGQATGQNVVNIAESDSQLLMVTASGYISSIARRDGYNLPVSWVFGEQVAQPLNINPWFAGTVLPWTAYGGGATIAYTTAWAYGQGASGSALLTPDGVTANPGIESETSIPVEPGVSYTVPVVALCAAGWAAGAQVIIRWLAAGGSLISSTAGAVQPLAAGSPTRLTAVGRAPWGAVTAQVRVQMAGTPSVTMYVAQAPLTTTATEYPYTGDVATDYDPTQVYNDGTLSQLAAPSRVTFTFTASTSGNLFYAAGSGFAAGQPVTLHGPSLPGGFSAGVTYYVVSPSPAGQVFQLAATAGGTAITVTGSGSGTVTATLPATGVTVATGKPASIAKYGDLTVQQTSYLTDPDAISDQAWWIVDTMGTLANRVAALGFDPSANPALWRLVLGVETGQVAQFNRRLGGTQLEISGRMQVMSVSHACGPRSRKTTLVLVPYTGDVLTADDVERGNLDGSVALGW